MIDVQLCRNACGAQPLEIADGLGVEWLAVADERIGGRQMRKIRQPRRSGVGRELCAVRAAQIKPPRKMVAARIPHSAAVVARRFRIAVVEHGVERHLKRDADLAFVPRADADGGAQPAACALTADHELIAADAERRGVRFQVKERGIAVVDRGRVGGFRRQPVSRRQHDCAKFLDEVNCAGGVYHFFHPCDVSAAVQPQNACGIFRRGERREQERGHAAVFRRDADSLNADAGIRLHRAHRHPPLPRLFPCNVCPRRPWNREWALGCSRSWSACIRRAAVPRRRPCG